MIGYELICACVGGGNRITTDESALCLARFFEAEDLTRYQRDMADLTGIAYGGVVPL